MIRSRCIILMKRTGGSTPIPILVEVLEFLGRSCGARLPEEFNGAGVVRFCSRRLGGLYAS